MTDADRPIRPALSRDVILRAALGIVDRDGPEKLTMRRLGRKLGVDPMTIYHYVPNKVALFDGILELIWRSLDLDSIELDGAWQQQLATVMHALRDTLCRHPRAVAILGTRPVTGPDLFALLDRLLDVLTAAGMPLDAELLNNVVTYTVGHVLAEVGEPVGGETEKESHLMVRPDLYPHLAAVFNSGWRYNADRQYERGLQALIGGWQFLLPERAPDPSP